MMRMTDPVSELEPVPEPVSGVVPDGVSGVVASSSTGYTATAYPAFEDSSYPTSGWLEVENYPDTMHHCCVVNILSMTSARTRAQEVLALNFSQLPSVICNIGQFAGRGLLQFARVAEYFQSINASRCTGSTPLWTAVRLCWLKGSS